MYDIFITSCNIGTLNKQKIHTTNKIKTIKFKGAFQSYIANSGSNMGLFPGVITCDGGRKASFNADRMSGTFHQGRTLGFKRKNNVLLLQIVPGVHEAANGEVAADRCQFSPQAI